MKASKDGFGPERGALGAIEENERVKDHLSSTIGDQTEIIHLVMGMVPAGTRRLMTEIRPLTDQQRVVLLHSSRTITNAQGAMLCLDRGLIIEGFALARNCLENVAQGIAFMRDGKLAASWLRGTEFKPWKIRDHLNGSPDVTSDYNRLSKLAHPNVSASRNHSLEVPPSGFGIFYGGSFRPKLTIDGYALLTRTVYLFVQEFFRQYQGHLDLVAWPLLFKLIDSEITKLEAWAASLDDDEADLAAYFKNHPGESPIPQVVTDEEMIKMREASLKAFGYGGPPHRMPPAVKDTDSTAVEPSARTPDSPS